MNNPYDIIIKPVITEKSSIQSASGKYTFIVDSRANKVQIRQAVEELFDVKVLGVNTANYDGKIKRQGATSGRTPSYKKAVVSIDTDPKAESYLGKGSKSVASSKKYKTTIEEFGFGG